MQLRELTAETQHEIEIHGLERMVLKDRITNQAIAVAERTGGHTWTITAQGQEGATADNRSDAVDEMNEMALRIGREKNPPETGYSVTEPIYTINDELVELRDLP